MGQSETKLNILLKKNKRKNTALDFTLGALLGLAVFGLIYGFSTLNVQYDSWIFAGYIEEDIIQSYGGWMYFRNAAWSMPLGVANNISRPIGMSVAFTDGVPLLEVILKIFAPILPATFQYFGWYNLFNFIMMGGFSFLLVRGFKLGRIYSAIASLLFLTAPIFLERSFRHSALASQWLILAALYLYFKSRRPEEKFPVIRLWVLCTLAVGIHSYFLPMVYAIFFAALIYQVFKNKKALRYVLYLAGSFVPVLGLAYLLGILTRGGDGSSFGFGSYSMNLNALFNPSSFDWYAESGQLEWSRIMPVLPQYKQQYDGFNYAGAGILLALLGMVIYAVVRICIDAKTKRKDKLLWGWQFAKSHGGLIFVCVCLSAFAISNIVTIGQTTLFSIPLPNFALLFAGVFRSSGRVFWVCNYLLILSVVVFVGRVCKPYWKEGILLATMAVQLFDISGVLRQKHDYFAQDTIVVENQYNSEGWQFLAENYDTVNYLSNLFNYNLTASFIRYNPNVVTNAFLANRGSYEVIAAEYEPMRMQLISGQPLENSVLYVCDSEETFELVMQYIHEDAKGYKIGDYYFFGNPVAGSPLQATDSMRLTQK